MERLFPPPCVSLAPEDVYRTLQWPGPPAERPFVAVNMVTTVDGSAALDGRSQGIGSRVDRQLMRQLRARADAVLCGAATLRAERVDPSVPDSMEAERLGRGLARQPLAVVVSASLDLPLDSGYFRSSRFKRVVLTGAAAPQARRRALTGLADVLEVGRERVDLPVGLARLRREWGVRWLLVEGGPHLNAELLRLGLPDELFWTVAPRLVGGGPTLVAGPPLQPDGRRALVLLSAHCQQDELYVRYRLARPSTA